MPKTQLHGLSPAPLLLGALLLWLGMFASVTGADLFLRGDVDGSRTLSVTDAVRILQFLFAGNSEGVPCQDAADVDDSGRIEVTDAVFLLSSLFKGGPTPPAPFPTCGGDPTDDALDCNHFEGCSATFQFFDFDLDGDGVFFVVDRSGTFQDAGEFRIAKNAVIRAIDAFPPDYEFAVLFADRDVLQWPPGGLPAKAREEEKASGIAFVTSVAGGVRSCDEIALMAVLRFAEKSSARIRAICYVTDGGGTCMCCNEAAYLEMTLEAITRANNGLAHIHSIQVGDTGAINEQYLRDLAERNAGTYHKVDR